MILCFYSNKQFKYYIRLDNKTSQLICSCGLVRRVDCYQSQNVTESK